jgi:hypothetical protein
MQGNHPNFKKEASTDGEREDLEAPPPFLGAIPVATTEAAAAAAAAAASVVVVPAAAVSVVVATVLVAGASAVAEGLQSPFSLASRSNLFCIAARHHLMKSSQLVSDGKDPLRYSEPEAVTSATIFLQVFTTVYPLPSYVLPGILSLFLKFF